MKWGPVLPTFLIAASIFASVSLRPAIAHEPSGSLIFATDGVETPLQGAEGFQPGEQLLRISVAPAEAVSDAVLIFSEKGDVNLRLVTLRLGEEFKIVGPSEGFAGSRVPLGALVPGTALIFDFATSWPEGSGGTAVFTIEGTASRAIRREGFAVVVGAPGVPGVLGDGAIEYPAHVLEEEQP